MNPAFHFDAERHEYTLDGVRLVSVTQALKILGGYESVPKATLERKRQIGAAVDLAIQMDIDGVLERDSLHSLILPYVEAWWDFRRDVRLDPSATATQECMFHPEFRYAGTPDIRSPINGDVSVIDVKCTAGVEKSFGPQLAAYQQLYIANDIPVVARYVLHLTPDRSPRYRLLPYRDNLTDWRIFQSCLSITHWLEAK